MIFVICSDGVQFPADESCKRGYRKSYGAIRNRGRVSCKALWLMSHLRLGRLRIAIDTPASRGFNKSTRGRGYLWLKNPLLSIDYGFKIYLKRLTN